MNEKDAAKLILNAIEEDGDSLKEEVNAIPEEIIEKLFSKTPELAGVRYLVDDKGEFLESRRHVSYKDNMFYYTKRSDVTLKYEDYISDNLYDVVWRCMKGCNTELSMIVERLKRLAG